MTVFEVSHQISWTVINHSETRDIDGASLPSVIMWSATDPLAVKVTFGSASGAVEWVFARELLTEVCFEKCRAIGAGDVHVARQDNLRGNDYLLLTLTTDQRLTVRADLEEIKFFLSNSFIYAQQGEEEVDIDTTITKLLDGGLDSV